MFPPLFTDLFTKTMGMTAQEFEYFSGHFRELFLRKKDYYIKEGSITNSKAYVKKGSGRTYIFDKNGKEHITNFIFEDWWLGDYESYYSGTPGKSNIQALEDMEVLEITKDDFSRLETEIPKLQLWSIKKQRRNTAIVNQLYEVKTSSCEERYLQLLEKHPQVFQRIPLQYIASYLDMEPPFIKPDAQKITRESSRLNFLTLVKHTSSTRGHQLRSHLHQYGGNRLLLRQEKANLHRWYAGDGQQQTL